MLSMFKHSVLNVFSVPRWELQGHHWHLISRKCNQANAVIYQSSYVVNLHCVVHIKTTTFLGESFSSVFTLAFWWLLLWFFKTLLFWHIYDKDVFVLCDYVFTNKALWPWSSYWTWLWIKNIIFSNNCIV